MYKNLKNYVVLSMLFIAATNLSAQYCVTGVGPTSTADSNTEGVNLTGDASTSISYTGCSAGGVLGVEDLTSSQIVNVTAGSAYTANVQFGTCGAGYAGSGEAWIDWNQNDVFEAGESIGTWNGTPPATLSAFPFTVSPGAFNGSTRMRVIQEESGINPLNPCASFQWGSVVDFTVVVSGGFTPTCPFPSLLTSANATTTTVDLGWTENGTATSWELEYGAQGFTLGTGTFVITGTNPYNLTGLNPSSSYDFYVRAICGPADTSAYSPASTFQTLCGAIVAPFTETFAGTTVPNCWTDSGNDPFIFNTGAAYGAAVAGDHTSGGGTNYAWVDGSGPTGSFDTLTSPLVDVSGLTTAHLCFSLFSNDINGPGNNTINIEFYDGSTWNVLGIIQQNLGTAWVDLSYDLSGFTITGNTAVRFVISTNSTGIAYQNDILIDDVSINNGGCPATAICIAPAISVINATNITANSADLGWFENNGSSSWQIEWDITGFIQGTGTVVTTSTNPHSLTGLTPNTAYDVYVTTICGAGNSSIISGPFTFTTLALCPFPSLLTSANATTTTVDLGWTENGTATSWELEYGAQGFTTGSGTSVITGTNPHNLTGLTANTSYDFYVRAICGVGDSSAWTGPFTFNTLCAPFSGDFPNTSFIVPSLPYSTSGNTSSCYTDSRDNSSADVWYQYIVAPCTDSLTISLCGSAFDTYLRVYADDTTTQIFFNDDDATCTVGNNSYLVIDVAGSALINPGDTIYIMVEGYGANVGAYSLNISDVINCPPPANLVITEIMYNPPESGVDSLEFVEIYNNGTLASDLTNYTLSGISYTFPAVTLPVGGYYVIGVNASAFNTVYGFAPDGIATGGLSNGGESIVLKDATGFTIDSVRYDDSAPWPSGSAAGEPDGGGASIILCNTTSDNNDGANWSASADSTGSTINGLAILASPGAANTCAPPAVDVATALFLNVDSTYCNAGSISGSVVFTNLTGNTESNIPYSITAGGVPIGGGVITTLAGNASDTITIGPLPAATGVAMIMAWTAQPGDSNTSNDTLSMMVYVSNTSATANVTVAILCNGDSTGEVRGIGADGLALLYDYQWNATASNATTAIVPNLGTGTYIVTITDSIGCADTAMIMLTEPTAISTTDSVSNILCNGDSTGSSTIIPSGGSPGYSFMWSNGNTNATATNLGAGPNSVTISDNNGCTSTTITTITEPSVLVASAVDNANGSATASGSGGSPSYSFLWDATAANQTTATSTGLTNNTYNVTVTDNNGCTDTVNITITGVGFGNIAIISNLNMFPNPTNGNVFVELDLVNNADVEIVILNSIGQHVMSKVLNNIQSKKVELQTADLPSGVYMVQFTIANDQLTRKLIISKQ